MDNEENDVEILYDEEHRKLILLCDGVAFSRLSQLLASDPSMANDALNMMNMAYDETREIIGNAHTFQIVNSSDAVEPQNANSQFYILWVIAIVIVGMLTMGFISSGIIVWLDRM